MNQRNVPFEHFTKKTCTISFMAAPIRAPFGIESAIGGLVFRVKI